MSKSFLDYLTETKKTFDFKVWVANSTNTIKEKMDAVEKACGEYKLIDISKIKSLPVREDKTFFPGYGPVEVDCFTVSFDYPVNASQVQELLIKTTGIPGRNIVVTSLSAGADDSGFEVQEPVKQEEKKQSAFANMLTKVEQNKTYEEYKLQTFKEDPAGTKSPVGSNKK